MFVGKGAAFEGRKGLSLGNDFPDGTSTTLMIVEAGEAVPWTKPADLPYARDEPLPRLGGLRLRETIMAAFADGTVRPLWRGESEATLRGLITRNGGESQ